MRRVAAVAKKTIVVLIGGRPLTFNYGPCVAAKKHNAAAELEVGAQASFPWDPSQSVGAACGTASLLANVSALFMAWRPGAQGGPALFDLLSGTANPSAHMPVAWPRSAGGIGAQVTA